MPLLHSISRALPSHLDLEETAFIDPSSYNYPSPIAWYAVIREEVIDQRQCFSGGQV